MASGANVSLRASTRPAASSGDEQFLAAMALPELGQEIADRRPVGGEQGAQIRKRGDQLGNQRQIPVPLGLRCRHQIAAPSQVRGTDAVADGTACQRADIQECRGGQADDQRAADGDDQAGAQGPEGLVVARLLLLVLCMSVAASSSAFAQQRGSITGKVLDPDGLALPGATVTVTEQNTGFNRMVVTAQTGAYSVASR